MGKNSKVFKDKEKNRLDDLQGLITSLLAIKGNNSTNDKAVLEMQVNQMMTEWKAELNKPSPASSHNDGSLGSFSSDLYRMLQQFDVEDDATSGLAHCIDLKPVPEPNYHSIPVGDELNLHEGCFSNQTMGEHGYQEFDDYIDLPWVNNSEATNQLAFDQFDVHQDFQNNNCTGLVGSGKFEEDSMHYASALQQSICHPSSSMMKPKCALWDCCVPAQYQDYCCDIHASSAFNEGQSGMTPVVRHRGISLQDDPLFATLHAKMEGKDVGIPECEGAATMKCPWNSPELFDISFFEGETIREWLYFDKPRKAFKCGNRKQKKLPDYSGRGWHESRGQMMKEYGGVKKSYYMDPQPLERFAWHLYEYVMDNCDALILCRLTLKFVDEKKSPKGKIIKNSIAELQKQMGRLVAESPTDNELSVKHETEDNLKDDSETVYSTQEQMAPSNDGRY
ncbi:hypothetical protein IFM89_010850 [Coptis chinensis]|uniref:Transcription factor VOZ1 n=1 Tax=Coptis chinensis TaxID=261450 RepID=A0A835I2B2_9MAGN|nr:hypothetical protein IFM89_010850 [Coptis chinensis]